MNAIVPTPPRLPPVPISHGKPPVLQGMRAVKAAQAAQQTRAERALQMQPPPTFQALDAARSTREKLTVSSTSDLQKMDTRQQSSDLWFVPTMVGLCMLLLIGLVFRSTASPVEDPIPPPTYIDRVAWAATPETNLVCSLNGAIGKQTCPKDPIDVIEPLQNLSGQPLALTRLHSTMSNPLVFDVISDTCSNQTIPPGQSCLILYRINMQNILDPGAYRLTLTLPNIAGDGGTFMQIDP